MNLPPGSHRSCIAVSLSTHPFLEEPVVRPLPCKASLLSRAGVATLAFVGGAGAFPALLCSPNLNNLPL